MIKAKRGGDGKNQKDPFLFLSKSMTHNQKTSQQQFTKGGKGTDKATSGAEKGHLGPLLGLRTHTAGWVPPENPFQ